MLAPWKKSYDQSRQCIKNQTHYFANKSPFSQSYGFSNSYVWMWVLDYEKSLAMKNWWFELWCWRTLLKVPWTARRSNQSIIKEISPEYSLEKTDVEAETLILWLPDVKNWLIWKDPDAGKDLGQEEKETTEDEIVGLCHWLNGHEFGWTSGVGDGQGGLACCGPWGRRVGHDWATELTDDFGM